MIKDVQILENNSSKVTVNVTINKRKLATDKQTFIDEKDVKLFLQNKENIDLSNFICKDNVSLCNYSDPARLSATYTFKAVPKLKTISTMKSSLGFENTNLTPDPKSDKVETKPVKRKTRRRVSTTNKEDKLL
tara:strand:+ start:2425 stop:2823 length:399 start_codon:yes stop_codon:yes gene_type:complete